MAHAAYEKGFLPSHGGIDHQPALFQPTMVLMQSALDGERDMEAQSKERAMSAAKASRAKQQPKYAKITTPSKARGRK
jgi:hypothetical protein